MKCLGCLIYLLVENKAATFDVHQNVPQKDKQDKNTFDGIALLLPKIIREKALPANFNVYQRYN